MAMLVSALIAAGAYNATKLPIDAVPDITNNQVLVITTSPSLGAADIERLITFPVEQATRNIPGIIEQRSFSRFGLSLVTIVFDDQTDVYWARQQISERLGQIKDQIPPELGSPALGPVTTGLGEIFQYVVKPKPGFEHKYDATELRTIQDWIVRRQLLGTPGVADVSSFGGKLKQYEISLNYDRLRSYNLTIEEIFSALERNNQNTGGAYIEKGPAVLFIRTEGLINTQDDIGSIVIRRLEDGSPVSMYDVGNIRIGYATRYGAVTYNDEGEVAGAVVMMLKGENSNKVIRDVKEKIAQIEKTLPEGVMIEPFLDRTKMVNNAISTVEKNLLEGALIVVFILVLFLGNLRAGLLVASVIPLSMLFAIILMNIFGVSGNLMSLGALDFGLIVDGAVIVVESVMFHLHHNKKFKDLNRVRQREMDEEVNKSAGKMMNAAVFGQVIILIVYLPILTLQGIEGKMFKPMALTVAFAIMGAFLLSLTYIPMMSALLLGRRISHKRSLSDRIMDRVGALYNTALKKVMKVSAFVVGATILVFAIAIFILSRMGGEFIPKLEEGDFAVDTRVLTGSSLPTTIQATQQASRILLNKFPEVEKVVTKIGSGEIPTDPMPMEASDMMVVLKPKKKWTSARTFDELAEKMSSALNDVPGITTGFQFPVQMRFNELMTGGRQDVVCKIFGEDLDTLTSLAERLGRIVQSVDGAKDLYVETITGLPQIVVDYNKDALRLYGINVADANRTVQASFAGAVAGQIFENERRFDLVVRLEGDLREDVEDVKNLLIHSPVGGQVPLSHLANVEVKLGPNQIQRENAQRRTTIGFNVRGRDVQSIVKELMDKTESELKLPPGYYIEYGGQFENLLAARKRLSIAVPVSLLLIFILLYFAFHSVSLSLLIYSAIPLSAIGGIFALWIRGMPFSISAGIGFIALFGVAVLNGIVLITEFNQLKKEGVADIRERIFKGTFTRLRPVMMTASVASLGFLPMAISNGAGAEVQRPLATVVIGGLVSATFLTLFVLPILYRWFEEKSLRKILPEVRLRSSKKRKVTQLLLLLIFLSAGIAQAQTPISLDAAIDTALSRHPGVLAARLKTSSAERLESSAFDLPATAISSEFGRFNTAYADTRFGISQSFSFPQVYRRQKELLHAQTEALSITEAEVAQSIRKEVSTVYFRLVILRERRRLLQLADSIFSEALTKQQQRFDVGDINILEKTGIESQRMQVANQLRQLDAEMVILSQRFSSLLVSNEIYVPDASVDRAELSVSPGELTVLNQPSLKMKVQEMEIWTRSIEAERTKLLPQLTLGYSNQSIRGFQNIDGIEEFYTGGDRFSSFNLGIDLPIFNRSTRARISAGKISREATRAEYEELLRVQSTRLNELLLQYERINQNLEYFERFALPQARLIREVSTSKLTSGDIGYIEWMMLTNESIKMEADYFSAIEEWNATVIELNAYAIK